MTDRQQQAGVQHEAAQSMLAFTQHTMPAYEVNWHHAVLCEYLDRFVAGAIPRLMVFMPPRHGKSELVSRRLPAYILGRLPNTSIIACSYGADLASRMNRDVQRIIDTPQYAEVFPNTKLYGKNIRTTAHGTYLRNSDIFEIVHYTGVYRSAGVGGGITGMGGHYALIDDPIKNREEADSPTYRDAVWEWYTSTFYTRLEKNGAILITLTRWHEDDLAGRLLDLAASDPHADQWEVIRFPAVAEPGDRVLEDTREDGAPLWENKYSVETLDKIRATIGPRQWSALYQQRPRPAEGAMFKKPWFDIVGAVPANARRVRYWDTAGADEGKGDYTAGALMARDSQGLYYVEDVVHGQWTAHPRNSMILQTAELDRQRYGQVATYVEQPPGLAKESTDALVRLLAGFNVHADRVSMDKVNRAEPYAAQCEAGNVKLISGVWNRAYLDELCAFPYAAHDDLVDASSGAFNQLAVDATGFVHRYDMRYKGTS